MGSMAPERRGTYRLVIDEPGVRCETWRIGYMKEYSNWLNTIDKIEKKIREGNGKEKLKLSDVSPKYAYAYRDAVLMGSHYNVLVVQNLREISLMAEIKTPVPYYVPDDIPPEIAAIIHQFASENGIQQASASFIEAAAKNKNVRVY